MSIALIVTRGFGNGTLIGDIAHVVTRGYDISAIVSVVSDPSKASQWDADIILAAVFDSRAELLTNYDSENTIQPTFKAKIDG